MLCMILINIPPHPKTNFNLRYRVYTDLMSVVWEGDMLVLDESEE